VATAEATGRDEAVRHRTRLREPAIRGAQLLAASGFALAQPLFDILGKNAEFFAVRGSPPLDIVTFALAVTFVPALLMLAAELVVGLASRRAAEILHLVFLGFLAAVVAVQAFKRAGVDGTLILVAFSVLAGVGAAVLFSRVAAARSFLTILAAAPLVFLGLFLFNTPVKNLVFPSDVDVSLAAVQSDTPVVFVLFDEFPVISLLDEEDAVDESRFPNFARLSRSSTWFRNTTTYSPSTVVAVPSMLSSKFPQRGKLPVYQNHPDNLFTLLGGQYELNVTESQTRLCPPSLCDESAPPAGERLSSLYSDARVVYLHLLSPPGLEDRLPVIDESWGNFGKEGGNRDAPDQLELRAQLPKQNLQNFYIGREDSFADFIRSIKAPEPGAPPTLDFIHVLLPHGPWLHFPNGRGSAVASPPAPGRDGELWWNEDLAEQAWQRHLLQLGYTDLELGRLIEKLEKTGLWDKALIVVTADHGISFREGDRRRTPTESNLAELAFTPLFVKLPGQSTGREVTKHVTILDILPTIADVLGIDIPWDEDGTSGLQPGAGPDKVTVGRVSDSYGDAVNQREASLERQHTIMGTGAFDDAFFGLGPYGDLVGEPLSSVSLGPPVEASAVVDELGSALLRDFPRKSPSVPSPLVGTVQGLDAGTQLALVLNGTVEAVGTTYQHLESPVRFSFLVRDGAFQPGENAATVYVVSGTPGAPTLREVATSLSDSD
jgi:sulfatase-like protein